MPAAAACRLDEVKVEFRIVGDDDGVRGKFVEIAHPLARDARRSARRRANGAQAARLIVVVRVERGHVDALDLREGAQKLGTRKTLPHGVVVCVHQSRHDDLALADDEGVDEETQRLGVERGARPAREDDGVLLAALRRQKFDLAKLQDAQQVEVVHLEGDGKADQREAMERLLVLQAQKRRARTLMLALFLVARQEKALARRVGTSVQEVVDDVQPEVRHADEVGIGVYEREGAPRARRKRKIALLAFQLLAQTPLDLPAQDGFFSLSSASNSSRKPLMSANLR